MWEADSDSDVDPEWVSGEELEPAAKCDFTCMLLMLGDAGVGKSSLMLRFSDNTFTENHINTIGVDFKSRMIDLNDKTIKLQIWDTAGQERFHIITSTYYRSAHGIILCYDVTSKPSFQNLKRWLKEVDRHAQEGVAKILVGTKSDLHDKRVVSSEEAQELARDLNIPCIETSAKMGAKVQDAFHNVAQMVMERVESEPGLFEKQSSTIRLQSPFKKPQEKKCCDL